MIHAVPSLRLIRDNGTAFFPETLPGEFIVKPEPRYPVRFTALREDHPHPVVQIQVLCCVSAGRSRAELEYGWTAIRSTRTHEAGQRESGIMVLGSMVAVMPNSV